MQRHSRTTGARATPSPPLNTSTPRLPPPTSTLFSDLFSWKRSHLYKSRIAQRISWLQPSPTHGHSRFIFAPHWVMVKEIPDIL